MKMLFPARELKPYIRPIRTDELQMGSVYYSIRYLERDLLTPVITTMVYVGAENDTFSFQDLQSFRDGLEHTPTESDSSIRLYSYDSHSLASVYKFEEGLDDLLRCWLRRQERAK